MRLPYPERIPLGRVAAFAVLLFLIQTIEHTPLYFSAGCTAFLLIAAVTFNVAGGLASASGTYVFFYALLVVVVGVCYKAVLGEAADSNLEDPHTTIAVYVGIAVSMFAAVMVSRRFTRKVAFFQTVLKDRDMYRSAVGCLVFGIGGQFVISLLGTSGLKLSSAFAQLNKLVPLAILIAVMYEIRSSGGRRSMNMPAFVGCIYMFIWYGVMTFSKQGLITPFYCYILPVAALRYRLSSLQLVSCVVWAFITFHYLVPFSQYGRGGLPDDISLSQRLELATTLLSHPEKTRRSYLALVEEVPTPHSYYSGPQGFWERLQFISVDDALIEITDQGRLYGLSPIRASFLNAIPHIFYPNKPEINFGNLYAHEIGGLADDDTTTGVSFSAASDAYHMAKWTGVLIVYPLLLLIQFAILDSLFGNLAATPWGLLVVTLFAHVAPEGGISGIVYMFTLGTEIFAFSAFFAAWIAPSLAILILGRDRREDMPTAVMHPRLIPRTPI